MKSIRLNLHQKLYQSMMLFFLMLDVKLDDSGLNPVKAKAVAPKVSSATRLADLAKTVLCSL